MSPPRRHEIRMTDAEIDAFLDSQQAMILGTLGPGGFPHLVPMNYLCHGNSLVVVAFAKSQKVYNLRRDARATCLIEDGQEYRELRGVAISGRATVVDDPVASLEASRALLGRKLASSTCTEADRRDAPAQLARFEELAAKRVAILIERERTVSWDHRRLTAAY